MRKKLFALQDEKYKKFSCTLLPDTDNIIGVRVPEIRKIAKELAKGKWQDYKDDKYYEEIMLQGLIIGYAKTDDILRFELLKNFIPKIKNWGVCDIVCSNLKFTNKNKSQMWKFLQQYFYSDSEFEVRFAVVMLLNYFIDDDYIDRVLNILDSIKHDGYYAKMAVAWAISICFVKQWDKSFKYIKSSNLPEWTYNKSIQKACESYRISDDKKRLLKALKRLKTA